MTIDAIVQQALKLSAAEREEIVVRLIDAHPVSVWTIEQSHAATKMLVDILTEVSPGTSNPIVRLRHEFLMMLVMISVRDAVKQAELPEPQASAARLAGIRGAETSIAQAIVDRRQYSASSDELGYGEIIVEDDA